MECVCRLRCTDGAREEGLGEDVGREAELALLGENGMNVDELQTARRVIATRPSPPSCGCGQEGTRIVE